MLRGRWRATIHWWNCFLNWPPELHRIYRIYRRWGFDTLEIGCECGKVFDRRPQHPPERQEGDGHAV